MENMTLNMGEIIRDLRKSKSLTQDALAQAAGVSMQAVSKWETGQSLPDIALLPSLADFFGVTVDALFGRNPAEDDLPEPPAPECPFPSDDRLYVVQYLNGRMLSCEESKDGRAIRLAMDHVSGTHAVEVQGDARVDGAINGSVNAEGSAYVSGDINGSVNTGGEVSCNGSIHGSVNACGSVSGKNISCTMPGGKGHIQLSGLSDLFSGLSGMFGNRRTGNAVGAHMNAFFSGELPDDNVIRVVQMQGRRVMTAEESAGGNVIRLAVDHLTDPLNVEIYGSAEIRGNVHGNATAGDALSCENVFGSASAGDSMTCENVSGNASAGDSMTCKDVGGSVTAGDGVRCGSVGGNVNAGDSAHISGDVKGSVTASDSVTCGSIGGNVRADSVRCKDTNAQTVQSAPEADCSGLFASLGRGTHIVQVTNGRVLSAGECRGDNAFCLLPGDAEGSVYHIHGDATIEGCVEGDIRADGSVSCEGVEGDITAGGTVNCGGVEGDVSAGGTVSCGGVEGDVSAGGAVNCGGVEGDVSAGGTVNCGDVEGDVSAGSTVSCGDVSGDVSVQGSSAGCHVTCGSVDGDVSVLNASVECGDISGCLEARSDQPAECLITCGGVDGDVTAGNAVIECGDVAGCITAGSDEPAECRISCGSVDGDITAKNAVIECGDVAGCLTAGSDEPDACRVTCGSVDGDVNVTGSFSCEGDIGGSVYRR